MNETSAAVARKLADHPDFQWQWGMNVVSACGRSGIVVAVWETNILVWWHIKQEQADNLAIFPDLDDPATIGCVEAQARAIKQDLPLFAPENPGEPWVINFGITDHLAEGSTRGEVWANAFLKLVGDRMEVTNG